MSEPIPLEVFEARARAVRTREELEQLERNARAKGLSEHARIAAQVRLERFPACAKRGGGPIATRASFGSETVACRSGIDAYLWLVGKFLQRDPELLTTARSANKGGHDYFVKDPPHSGKYVQLPNGWYANTVLSNQQKQLSLAWLAARCGLVWRVDWDFVPEEQSAGLQSAKSTQSLGERVLQELQSSVELSRKRQDDA